MISTNLVGLMATIQQAGQASDEAQSMTALGWVFMIVSLTFVVGLAGYCYATVLSLPVDPAEDLEDEE